MKFAEEKSKSSIIHVSPFNSEKKRAGVAVIVVNPSFVTNVI
jgi:Ca2+-transporting ATPase